ncbi:MAG TPA: lysylphosphatidylglycerol synthase transmembrane domain-containing protein [Candidatus Limnocylindrales bacterium]|nr:lysylphosphatidylglycerol synthase transmembrane domain-containing protein [Candidatus Limnocylindrales bacterium]
MSAPFAASLSSRKWITLTALLGYLALALFLLYIVNVNQLISVIKRISPELFTLAVASNLIAFTFDALVWYQLLKNLSIKISFRRAYILSWVGVFVDNLIPSGWSGDFFKAYLLNKDPNVKSGQAVASVVAKNVYEAIFVLGGMAASLFLLFEYYNTVGSVLSALAGVIILLTLPLAILLVASFKPTAAKKFVSACFKFVSAISKKRWNLSNLEAKVEKAVGDYHEGMKLVLQDRKMVILPLLFSFFTWVFEVFTVLFTFAALGQPIPVDKVIIVRSVAGVVEAQGFAFSGYTQILTGEIYRSLGVPIAVGVSVALLGGILIFSLKAVISYVAFHYTVFPSQPEPSTNIVEPISARD